MNRDVCEHFTPVDLPCEKCQSASVQKSTQPEALRLADLLEMGSIWQDQEKAAAELRRLHEENERCREVCKATSECWRADAEKSQAQRDALLEALKTLVLATKDVSVGHYNEEVHDIALSKARAAIKQAEEKA